MHGWLARKGGVHDAPPTYIVAQFTEELVKLCSSLHTVNKERINYRSVTVSSP